MSWRSFCLAVLAGAVITLLTRMQHATDQLGVKIVPAVLLSFVLVGAQLFHSVLDSILMFAGLLAGTRRTATPTGSARWAGRRSATWSAALGLVTPSGCCGCRTGSASHGRSRERGKAARDLGTTVTTRVVTPPAIGKRTRRSGGAIWVHAQVSTRRKAGAKA